MFCFVLFLILFCFSFFFHIFFCLKKITNKIQIKMKVKVKCPCPMAAIVYHHALQVNVNTLDHSLHIWRTSERIRSGKDDGPAS